MIERGADMRVPHFIRRLARSVFLALFVFSSTAPTYANHVLYRWPDHAFLWLSSRAYHASEVWVVSNNCTFAAPEQSAIANTETMTVNTSELGDMKDNGYNLFWKDCSGQMSDTDDIFLQYEDTNTWKKHKHSDVGGVTFRNQAISQWCGIWGTYYPCGDHWVTIHLNLQKITKPNYPIVTEIMHELGHATGLDEHCTSDALMNNGNLSCNSGRFVPQWLPTDREGFYSVYHPHEAKRPTNWECIKVISEDIYETPVPRADVSPDSGRIFVGWHEGTNGIWRMAFSDSDGEGWTVVTDYSWNSDLSSSFATMLAHSDFQMSFYMWRRKITGIGSSVWEIWRRTYSHGIFGYWDPPVLQYTASEPLTGVSAAHSRFGLDYGIAWTQYVNGIPTIKFAFIDGTTGAFTGPIETVQSGAELAAFVFDEHDNPKVIYRTSGLQETGTGARRVRTGGVWGDAQTFTIDGLIDPDAFPLLEGEIAFRYSYQDYYSSAYGVGGDAYALKRVTAPLTFRYRKSENGSWSEEDINFANLARPITGPNTSNYNYHGLARLLYAWKSQVVATVMTNGSAGSDLWFCK